VSLTEIGRAYYERSSRFLAEFEEADRLAGALQATPQGTLRLSTVSSMVRFLVPVLSEFLNLYPAVSIDLTTEERMVDLVEEGFDLAVRTLPPPDSSLIVRRLASWRAILCCSQTYLEQHEAPKRPSDLTQHNCFRYAFYPYGNEWRFIDRAGQPIQVQVQGKVVTNNGEALRRLALMGQGLFFAPSFLVYDDIRAGRLTRLLEDYAGIGFAINAIYPHRHHLSAKVRVFIDLLAERFAEHQEWMDPHAGG
jgi:DNA-binding transcriptional LysR family regulator